MTGERDGALCEWLNQAGQDVLDAAVGAGPNIVAVVDGALKIRYINYAEQGFRKDRLIGASLLDITPADYHDASRGW
jgi:hypothetical protein